MDRNRSKVRVHEYAGGHLAVFHGPRRLAVYDAGGKFKEDAEKRAARNASTRAGLWIRWTRLTPYCGKDVVADGLLS